MQVEAALNDDQAEPWEQMVRENQVLQAPNDPLSNGYARH
jgi:hypothetical protein